MHARFRDETSDFMTLTNLWRYVREQQRALSSSAFRRMCKGEYLNYLRIREWQELEAQLRQVAKQLKLGVGPVADVPDADAIHQSLLAGLLSPLTEPGLARLYKTGLEHDGTRGLTRRDGRPFTPRRYLMLSLVLAALTQSRRQVMVDELVAAVRSSAVDETAWAILSL